MPMAWPPIVATGCCVCSSAGVMALSLSLCALVYAPIAAVQRPAVMPGASALGAIAILAVVCTAIAFLLFAALIDEIGPVRATVITYVNPAVAAALGVAVQRDPVTAAMGVENGHVRPGDRVAMLGIGSGINVVMLGIRWETV